QDPTGNKKYGVDVEDTVEQVNDPQVNNKINTLSDENIRLKCELEELRERTQSYRKVINDSYKDSMDSSEYIN
ncbi:hypothetical protein, partial [Salmonella sp. s51228]|uniref:hypothetical protein n=1 Tax=Salmonella sp. s51228 TaxID=3159652 RepID=UPI003980316C